MLSRPKVKYPTEMCEKEIRLLLPVKLSDCMVHWNQVIFIEKAVNTIVCKL